MKNIQKREKTINFYILSVQAILSVVVISYAVNYYVTYQPRISMWNIYISLFFLAASFILIFFNLKLNQINERQHYVLDFLIIVSHMILIAYLMVSTNSPDPEVLFLIPIIIGAIKFPYIINLIVAVSIGVFNALIKYFLVNPLSNEYHLELEMVVLGVFLVVSWLMGNVVTLDKEVRKTLYKNQAELMDNEALHNNIVSHMPLGVIVVDKKEKITHINQEALNINQIQDKMPQDFIQLPFSNFLTENKERFSVRETFIYKALKTGQGFYKEKRIRHGKILEFTSKPIFDDQGEVSHAMVIFQDVSYDEMAKAKLNHLENINLVGQMAASIAHEIKNPLTTISGFLQLAFKNKDFLTEKYLNLLVSEVDRCNLIINDFLAITKKTDQGKELVSLREIIEGQLTLIEKDAFFNKVLVNSHLEEVPASYLNQNEIKQIFLNLSRNAIEAMPSEGILTIKLENHTNEIILEIEDTGLGMSKDFLEKLGTPFMTTKENGTGIGFTVVKRLLENHQASIDVTSEIGIGTKITIAFPKK